MEETVAMTQEVMMEAPQTVDAPASYADLLGIEEQAPAPTQEPTVEKTAVDAPEAAQPQKVEQDEQARINQAIGREKRRVSDQLRREYENRFANDPARIAGQRMLEHIMRTQNCSAEQAAVILDKNYYAAMAEENNVTEEVARAIFDKRPQRPKERTAEDFARQIRQQADSAQFPEGFDFEVAREDEAFVQMMIEADRNPVQFAAMVYDLQKKVASAPQDLAEKIMAQKAIPKPIEAQAAKPAEDLDEMSDEAFLEMIARRKRRY